MGRARAGVRVNCRISFGPRISGPTATADLTLTLTRTLTITLMGFDPQRTFKVLLTLTLTLILIGGKALYMKIEVKVSVLARGRLTAGSVEARVTPVVTKRRGRLASVQAMI